MRRILCIAFGVALASCGSAHAGSVLLGTFRQDASFGGGSGPITELSVPFVLQLPTSPPQGPLVDPLAGVGQGVWWEEGDTGQVRFDAGNDPFFETFALYATDGVDDWVGIYTPWGGYLHRESTLFGATPDLYGFNLEHVLLRVDFVGFLPLPHLGGSEVLYDITYDFYGTPVPEPASVAYFSLGAAVLLGLRIRQLVPRRIGNARCGRNFGSTLE